MQQEMKLRAKFALFLFTPEFVSLFMFGFLHTLWRIYFFDNAQWSHVKMRFAALPDFEVRKV